MKIEIFTCRFGMGHLKAALSIEKQLANQYDVQVLDTFKELYPHYEKYIYGFYAGMIKQQGLFYKIFVKADNSKEETLEKLEFLEKRFFTMLDKREKPDVYIATYSVAAYFIAKYIRERGLSIPLVTCITDFTSHELWINEGTSLYLVATHETLTELVKKGVNRNRILVYGLSETSSRPVSDTPEESEPIHVLISGGGLGLLPEQMSFYEELERYDHYVFRIICGKNKRIYRKLKRKKFKNVEIYSFVDDMRSFMTWADVLVTKAGGMSTTEAIATETPVVYFPPYLTQEIRNAEFIEQANIGYELKDGNISSLAEYVDNRNELNMFKNNMRLIKSTYQREAFSKWIAERAVR